MNTLFHRTTPDGKIIVDACLFDDESTIEVMAMAQDGTEIETEQTRSAVYARQLFDLYVSRYIIKPLTGKYAKLRDDIAKALAVGQAAEEPGDFDGGTCNFDSPILSLPRWNKDLVEQAVQEAGTHCFQMKFCGCKVFNIGILTGSQASNRTTNAEATAQYLKSCGYDCGVYYAMD